MAWIADGEWHGIPHLRREEIAPIPTYIDTDRRRRSGVAPVAIIVSARGTRTTWGRGLFGVPAPDGTPLVEARRMSVFWDGALPKPRNARGGSEPARPSSGIRVVLTGR